LRVTQRRLASLAVAACLVLLVGLYVRRRLERADRPAPSAPPSEASALQQLSHEGLIRRASTFVGERAADVARFVVYVPETGASGLRWKSDTVLSVTQAGQLVASRVASPDSGSPSVRTTGDSLHNGWILAVGRTSSDAVLSLAGSLGGRAHVRCRARDVDELLVDFPLSGQLAGAGLFDLEGSLVGMVVPCGDRMAAIPARQITALLTRDSSSVSRELFGVSLTPLDDIARRYFRTDSGVVVTAVRLGGPAHSAGLRPGDILLSVDGEPITSATDLARAHALRPDSAHLIVRLRGRARATLKLERPAGTRPIDPATFRPTLGIDLMPEAVQSGVVVTRVDEGSVAQLAGLRVGDRITRIGTTDIASRSTASRLLGAASRAPTFVSFVRDSLELGVLVRP
jgi:S1-C subfamily serine protease